jgi:hypothetical protein
MLKETNVRKGFFEHDQYLALRGALPPYFKPFVSVAYTFGWRDEEIADLTWSQRETGRSSTSEKPGMRPAGKRDWDMVIK